jgi:phosphoglycolate phosphatase
LWLPNAIAWTYTASMYSEDLVLREVRLVLFDIDGTLLRNGNRIHGRSIVQACEETTGLDITQYFGKVNAAGRTDRYIMGELLRMSGMSNADFNDVFPKIAKRSVEIATEGFANPDPAWVLEGSHELISALKSAKIDIGLVTGNLPKVAELKLTCAQIWEPFATQSPLVTGFGDLSEDRNDLARAAFVEGQRHLAGLQPEQVVIIGDTPRDVECAEAIGARSVAVATGRFKATELNDAGATHTVLSLLQVAFA